MAFNGRDIIRRTAVISLVMPLFVGGSDNYGIREDHEVAREQEVRKYSDVTYHESVLRDTEEIR